MHLVLIDGSSWVYKRYYTALATTNADTGQPNGAISGFCETLWNLRKEGVSHIAVAFDTPGATFRHALLPSYKGQRPKKPDDLVALLTEARLACKAFGIECIEWPEHEADDSIASAAIAAMQKGISVSISTMDKDLFQLVQPGISVLSSLRMVVTRYDEEAVFAKTGVRPAQIPDWLAIVGDTSDNIPGIDGLGEKGAAQILQAFGSIEGILEHISRVARLPRVGKHAARLYAERDNLALYRQVATLRHDPAFDVAPLAIQPISRWKVGGYLEKIDHPALLREIRESAA